MKVQLQHPIEPLTQSWAGVVAPVGEDGLVHELDFDMSVYEEDPGVHVDVDKFRIRIIAYSRTGPHFDVARHLDGLCSSEDGVHSYRAFVGGPVTMTVAWR